MTNGDNMFGAFHEDQSDGSLMGDLINLCDELSEFNDYCAFLCDAYASIVFRSQDEEIGISTVRGVAHTCTWMKLRMEEINTHLRKFQERSLAETKERQDPSCIKGDG